MAQVVGRYGPDGETFPQCNKNDCSRGCHLRRPRVMRSPKSSHASLPTPNPCRSPTEQPSTCSAVPSAASAGPPTAYPLSQLQFDNAPETGLGGTQREVAKLLRILLQLGSRGLDALAVGNNDLAVNDQVVGWNVGQGLCERGHSMRPVMPVRGVQPRNIPYVFRVGRMVRRQPCASDMLRYARRFRPAANSPHGWLGLWRVP